MEYNELEELELEPIEYIVSDDTLILEELTKAEYLLEKIQNSNLVNKELILERQRTTVQGLLLAFDGVKKGLEYWKNLSKIKEDLYFNLLDYENV